MRGKLGPPCGGKTTWGNIPAYAGKTSRKCRKRNSIQEHPRVCGENFSGSQGKGVLEGTSPRMRGKQGREIIAFAKIRNIPAYAGKTIFLT